MGERLRSRSSPTPPPPPPPPLARSYEVLFCQSFDDLLEPLPSPDEVEDSTEIIRDLTARCVAYVGDTFVVKYGSEVEPIEGHTMRFARDHLDPGVAIVPRLLAIYQRPMTPPCHITYIVMERISGPTLDSQWVNLSDSRRKIISDQLGKVFASLRNIPHLDFYGSIDKTGLRDNLFWTNEQISAINGPFASMHELLAGMIARYIRDSGPRMQHKADFYQRMFPRALQGNGKPVFTHGDFQRKNVLCCPDGKIALVDWATAGWYPSYWEYATAMFACGGWKDDWHHYLGQILEEYPTEFLWMHMMRIEIWG